MNNEPVVIIGAGWAGLAAAVRLTQHGYKVTIFESAKHAGGRARSVSFGNNTVDNGQHLLIGAYTECLDLMKTVGIDIESNLKRLPLLLTVIDKPATNKKPEQLILKAPTLPAPLHLLYALVRAKGLKFKDRIAAIRFGLYLKKNNYQLKQDISVAELFKATRQTDILIYQLWEPLVLSTMNTPISEASANVFMRVFKDAFTNKRKDSELLIPTVGLSQLFPDAAINYIKEHGGQVHLKSRVESIEIIENQVTTVTTKIDEQKNSINTSNVIIATAPQNLKKLINNYVALKNINHNIGQFNYEPIVTVYLHYPKGTQLSQPMIGLSSTTSQWVFDRGIFCQQDGLFSIVISASGDHMLMDDDTLTQKVHEEIAGLFENKPALMNSFVVREKRATFTCKVNINDIRPANKTDVDGLYLAGDYTNTHYPATLEGAVRSGIAASKLITKLI
ncbi:MAG: hydroxysqualene dehydroxylase HpnE [Gammaproteobacteria bacterium]|nr:hydroxysqualene dehydroxylase HpnE [Gammaproteobacteria bacterium]